MEDRILQVETAIKENFEKIADTDETVMIVGEQEEEEVEKINSTTTKTD